MRVVLWLLTMLSVSEPSCRGGPNTTGDSNTTSPDAADPKPQPPPPDTKPDPCSAAALGLGSAAALPAWTIPAGCVPSSASGTAILRSDAELAGRVACTGPHGLDLGKQAVLAHRYTMSPASVGVAAFDDGKLITLVSLSRDPCQGDPMPMPMDTTAWYLLPADGERTFANRSCTVASRCQ